MPGQDGSYSVGNTSKRGFFILLLVLLNGPSDIIGY